MENTFFILVIALIIADFLVSSGLGFINHRWRKKPVPEAVRDVYSEEKYITYQNYKQETYRLSVITSFITLAATLVMFFIGFALLDNWLRELISGEIALSIVFFAVIGIASDLLSLPFDIYSTFKIEQKYGFNTMTVKTFILDKLKTYMLAVIIGFPLLYLIIWLYMTFGDNFWWMVWIVISVFSIIMSLLYSSVIVPLFNKQSPLPDGELREEIAQLAERTGFKLDNVYVIDGSKRSTRANAYFTGFGAKKRIVLYDTLLNTQSSSEIISVLAHEIGHYKKKHTIKGLITSIIQTGLLLFLFSRIMDYQVLYDSLGVVQGFHIGLIVFAILYSPVSFVLSIWGNYISRKYEYQADNYAAEVASGEALITSLKGLSSSNLSDLNPHPLYVKAYYSHPPLIDRVKAL